METCKAPKNIIDRIQKMESLFDHLQTAWQDNPSAFADDEELQRMYRMLIQYYEGGQWLEDYARDERGEIPAGLKRGILSEDAVYNFISSVEQ